MISRQMSPRSSGPDAHLNTRQMIVQKTPNLRSRSNAVETAPGHVNPIQWNQALGYARAQCARVFRDGGTPTDAMKAFGLRGLARPELDWAKAVQRIALLVCQPAR